MEIIPGVHRFVAPLQGTPLGAINIYLLEGPEGSLLIDTGWKEAGAWEDLLSQFAADGVKAEDITDVVVTHAHADHCGLASEFKRLSGARIVMHHLEEDLLRAWYDDTGPWLDYLGVWLTEHGVTGSELPGIQYAFKSMIKHVIPAQHADREVADGEVVSNGAFDLRVVLTPGHAPGHICLYEPGEKLLFTGDHVLPHITPHIGAHPSNCDDPLGSFIASLKRLLELPAFMVLPAHGEPFARLRPRVEQLLLHHEERQKDILNVLDCSPRTAYEVATMVNWMKDQGAGTPYDRLGYVDKQLALAETLSHLELLLRKGMVVRTRENGHITHVLAGSARIMAYPTR